MKKLYNTLSLLLILLAGSSVNSFAQTTYLSTGTVQTYTVGGGVYALVVDAYGGCGGSSYSSLSRGGYGGRVQCTLAVTAGQVLRFTVGNNGSIGTPTSSGASGGYNGGGGAVYFYGGGGGGATDIRLGGTAVTNRVVVAGGGGGAGRNCGTTNEAIGGDGGALTGLIGRECNVLNSSCYGGFPGSQTAGGAGSTCGSSGAGALGLGGDASSFSYGGGGGSGYWGGSGSYYGGGGGGSSYTSPTLATAVVHTQGGNTSCTPKLIINALCNPPVAGSIIGYGAVCVGQTTTLSDPTGTAGGIWHSSDPTIATVDSTSGVVTGLSEGLVTITYGNYYSCGTAEATRIVMVNPLPDPITGPGNLCEFDNITLSTTSTGGSWSSSNTGVATIDASGVVTGTGGGTAIISYTFPTGCYSLKPITVKALPSPVIGPNSVCLGLSMTLSDTATGGTWSSSAPTIASVGSSSGIVSGLTAGTATISYSNGCGTPAISTITVNALPAPISGFAYACTGMTTILSDATPGGTWTSSAPSTAAIDITTGVVNGITAGTATITYTLATSCITTRTVTIEAPPTTVSGANSVCVGQTTTLSVSTPGGTWRSSSPALASVGSTTGIVTGVSMGTVQITYTIGIGCNISKTLTVHPLAPIGGRDSVCIGATGVLTDIVGGGNWTSANTGIATINATSGMVTGVAPGVSLISYTLPTGCRTTRTMHVINNPPPIMGVPQTCPGQTTVLSDPIPGGTWSTANPFVATVSAGGVVTGGYTDTVTIFYTINPGCSVGKVILVNPLPAPISGNVIACPGTNVTLSETTPGGTWSSGTPTIATVDTSGVVTAVQGGTAVISYTLPTGCMRTKSVAVYPIATPVVTYDWYSATLSTPAIWVSYQWYDSLQGLITGATSPTLAALYSEYYYVIVTDTNGCKSPSAKYIFDAALLGIKNTGKSQISIYPNPADDVVYINAPQPVKAVISGIDGKIVITKENATSVDVSRLASGAYLVTLYDREGHMIAVDKLTKK